MAINSGEATNDLWGVQRVDLEELSVVDDTVDDLLHVVGGAGGGGQNVAQVRARTVTAVRAVFARGFFQIVRGQEGEQDD